VKAGQKAPRYGGSHLRRRTASNGGYGKISRALSKFLSHQKAAMQGVDPGVKVTVTTVTVWLHDDTAYETGKYKYEYKVKVSRLTDEGRYVTIWKTQKDGSWKLAMDMGVPQ